MAYLLDVLTVGNHSVAFPLFSHPDTLNSVRIRGDILGQKSNYNRKKIFLCPRSESVKSELQRHTCGHTDRQTGPFPGDMSYTGKE